MLFLQLVSITALGLTVFLYAGMAGGAAVMWGGLAYWLPTLCFVWRVFRHTSVRQAKQFVVAFFVGEVFKLICSAGLFLWVVTYLPVDVKWVLLGFFSAIVAFWGSALWL